MTWNSNWPLGTVSVKANRTTGNQNTTYIETTMGNEVVGTNTVTTRDHFWDVGSDEDGRHRFIQSPAFTVGGLPENPVIGNGMDSVFYSKLKDVSTSVQQQDVQPFFRNVKQVMQILGIRACVVFNSSGTITYSFNVDSVDHIDTGLYRINYSNDLPSNSYLALGSGMRDESDVEQGLYFAVQGGLSIDNSKSISRIKIMFKNEANSLRDPLQAWVVCFGG